MMYEFEALDTGERVEYPFLMGDAPSIGDVVEIPVNDHTVLCRRIASDVRCQDDNWKPYVSNRLPPNLADQPTDKQGRVIVHNRTQERDICSRFGYTRT